MSKLAVDASGESTAIDLSNATLAAPLSRQKSDLETIRMKFSRLQAVSTGTGGTIQAPRQLGLPWVQPK